MGKNMKNLKIANGKLEVSQIALGCMRIAELGKKEAVRELVDTAMEQGVQFFDHADIYAGGEAERLFGEAVQGIPREQMVLQKI